jgi:hypothetical protein
LKKSISLKVASGLAVVSFVVMTEVPPASAHVVEAVASVSTEQAGDREKLDGAIQAAIDDVVTHAIAFQPTVVSLLDAKVVGDRIYLFVLIADKDGEEAIRVLLADRPPRTPQPPPTPSETDASYRLYR